MPPLELFQGTVLSLSGFALACRFLDYIFFNSRPPPGSEACSRFPDDAALQRDLERQLAEMDDLDEQLRALQVGHSVEDDAPSVPPPRKPRGAPPPPAEGAHSAPQRPRLTEQEANAHVKRLMDSAFFKRVFPEDLALGFPPVDE